MTHDSNKNQRIEQFFECYLEWISELFPELPEGHSMKNSEAALMINHEYAIFKTSVLRDEIVRLSERNTIPDYYIEFLLSYSYRALEVPLFSFPSTHPNDNLREIKSYINHYIEFGLIPFASNKSGTGIYCIDLNQDEAVVFYKNDEQPSLSDSKKKLASSFLSILIFLKEYLDWGGNISGLDDEDKPEALAELKNIDSEIGIAWEEWWLPRLLVNE